MVGTARGILLLALLAGAAASRRHTGNNPRGNDKSGSSSDLHKTAKPNGITLAFVIDSTGSMTDDIQQVKEGTKAIFKTMLELPDNAIYNFVLVPFNDPLVGPVLVTTDPVKFDSRLNALTVFGGGDCKEKSLRGLRLAVERSLPGSYIYMFTDATAKDDDMLSELQSLIQLKHCQVVFVLTGDCGGHDDPGYKAYEQIADTSFGQVFNLKKDEVKNILEFVNYSVRERNKVNMLSEDKPGPGRTTFIVPVDSLINTLTVSVSGKDPVIHLTNPKGKDVRGKPILKVSTALVVTVSKPDQGNWSVNVGSTSDHHIRVTAGSEFSFDYGFSTSTTDKLALTSPRPVIGTKTTLLLKVTNPTQLSTLTNLKVRDHKGKVIQKLNLHSVKGQPGLYRTNKFLPPDNQFYLEVHGIDNMGFPLERISPTAINPQIPGSPPEMKTLPKVKLSPGVEHEVLCKVKSNLNYTVNWTKVMKDGVDVPVQGTRFFIKKTGNLVINPVEPQDESWYRCSAQNQVGKTERQMYVEVSTPVRVWVRPETVYFVPGETIKLFCRAEGPNKLNLEWKKDGKSIETPNSRLQAPAEKDTLNLNLVNVNKHNAGQYECTAKNNMEKDVGVAKLVYMEYPTARPENNTVLAVEGTTALLKCNITGKPQPKVKWLKNGRHIKSKIKFQVLPEGDLNIPAVSKSSAGAFTCIAENTLGNTHKTITLKVGTAPTLTHALQDVSIPVESNGSIPCHATGYPKPQIRWRRKDGRAMDSVRFSYGQSCTLNITDAKLQDGGVYIVTLENNFGKQEMSAAVTVTGFEPPAFKDYYQETKVSPGGNVTLPCYASGYPPPDYLWMKNGSPLVGESGIVHNRSVILKNVQPDMAGTYKCEVTNVAGHAEKSFYLSINDVQS